MLPARSYISLDETNIAHLDGVISQRWRKQRKTLLISFSLPLAFGVLPALFRAFSGIDLENPADALAKFLATLQFLCLPVLLLVAFANLMLISKKFRHLYADKKAGKKLCIPFHPYPYCIPELKRFYIKTNIVEYPYIPVDQQTYYWMNTDQVLFMELAPKSKVLFDIKAEEAYPVNGMVVTPQTPSHNVSRIR